MRKGNKHYYSKTFTRFSNSNNGPYTLDVEGVEYDEIDEAYRIGDYGLNRQVDSIQSCYTDEYGKWYQVVNSRTHQIVAIIGKVFYQNKTNPWYEPYVVFTPVYKRFHNKIRFFTRWNCHRPIYANSPKTIKECIDKVTDINGRHL